MIKIFFLFILHLISPEPIKFTILYEKQVENTVGETYRIYLEQLIKAINETISKTEKENQPNDYDPLRIELEGILAHNQYKEIPLYDEISRYAGGNNIHNRVKALSSIQKNVILAISTTLDEDMDGHSLPILPCEKISYMVNLDSQINLDNDLLTNLHYGILHVLSEIFGFRVPNLLDKKNVDGKNEFIANLRKMDYSRFDKCLKKNLKDTENNENTNEKEKEKFNERKEITESNFKSTLKESDEFVNEFGKLMSMLKKKEPKDEDKKDIKNNLDHNRAEDDSKDNINSKKNKNISLIESSKDETNHNNLSKTDEYDKKNTEEKEKDRNKNPNLNNLFSEILYQLKGLRNDITENKNKTYNNNYLDNHNELNRSIRRRPYSNRRYEDYKTESVVPMTTIAKTQNSQELEPFQFQNKKTFVSDLKVGNDKKRNE